MRRRARLDAAASEVEVQAVWQLQSVKRREGDGGEPVTFVDIIGALFRIKAHSACTIAARDRTTHIATFTDGRARRLQVNTNMPNERFSDAALHTHRHQNPPI